MQLKWETATNLWLLVDWPMIMTCSNFLIIDTNENSERYKYEDVAACRALVFLDAALANLFEHIPEK